MKRITGILLFSAFTLFGLLSCSGEKNTGPDGGHPLEAKFHGGLITTRAQNGQWDLGDAIGISMFERGTATLSGSVFNYHFATNTVAGDFAPYNSPNNRIFFPQDGSEVTFRSYYPYMATLPANMVYPVSVKSQDNLPAIDLMTADHMTGFSKNDRLVKLNFHHRLSNLIFKIKVKDGQPELNLEDMTMTIKGMNTNANYDLLEEPEDALDIVSSIDDIVVPDKGIYGDVHTRQAIVLPREAGEGVSFEFYVPELGAPFSVDMRETLELESEYKYTFNITLSRQEPEITVTIEEWKEAPEIELEALIVGVETADGPGDGEPGDEFFVYTGTETAREALALYRMNAAGTKWESFDPSNKLLRKTIYWDELSDPTTFYAQMFTGGEKLNETQVDNYMIDQTPHTLAMGKVLDFTLSHPVAQVLVQLRSSTFTAAELKNMEVILPGYIKGGKYESGKYIPGTAQGDIELELTQVDDGNGGSIDIMQAFIDPQIIAASRADGVVNIVNPDTDVTYKVVHDAEIDFKAGFITALVIDMDKTEPVVTVKYVDWERQSTIPLVVSGLEIFGEYGGPTSDFFIDKTIYIYRLSYLDAGSNYRQYTSTYDGFYWNGDEIYWDDALNEQIKLTGYYFPEAITLPILNATQQDFVWDLSDDQSAGHEKFDILAATWEASQARPEFITLDFGHPLSRIRVELHSDEFTEQELAGATLVLNNLKITGNVDVAGAATSDGALADTLKPVYRTYAQEAVNGSLGYGSYSALIYPQTIMKDDQIGVITLADYPGNEFKIVADKDYTFLPGKEIFIHVKLTKFAIEFTAKYNDWELGGEGSIEID